MQQNREIWDKKIQKIWLIWKENCPFCKKNIDKEEKKLILKETDFWEIRYNKYPYSWIKDHLLAFPKRHIEFTKDLNEKELVDFKNVSTFINNYFKEKEYFSFVRESFTGRSIAHLHYHYLPWNIHSSDFEKILNKN